MLQSDFTIGSIVSSIVVGIRVFSAVEVIPVLLMFESVLARDESHHAAFGMNVFTAALEAAIRAVRIDRPLLVTLYR